MKRLTKFILPVALVVAFVAYALYQRLGSASSSQSVVATGVTGSEPVSGSGTGSGAPISVPTPSTSTVIPASTPSTPASTPVVTPTTSPTPAATGAYKDGTYTGTVADAYYGNIQVQAIIKGGVLADLQCLQYPHDQGTSRQISAQSTPLLRSEAIKAQSANVSIVSGATQTSQAFIQSLSSALAQAKV